MFFLSFKDYFLKAKVILILSYVVFFPTNELFKKGLWIFFNFLKKIDP